MYNFGMSKSSETSITKSMLDASIKGAVEDIAGIIGEFSDRMDERFNKVESDVAELKSDVADLNRKYDHLVSTLDAFIKRLDDAETENTARDAHLARIDRWLHQLADQAGVKLN